MKKLIMLVMLVMPVFAQAEQEGSNNLGMIGDNELQQIFLNKPLNLSSSTDVILLSDKEMIETEGQMLPWMLYVTVAGGVANSMAYFHYTPSPTWGGAGLSFGAGATAALYGTLPISIPLRAGLGAFGFMSWYQIDCIVQADGGNDFC